MTQDLVVVGVVAILVALVFLLTRTHRDLPDYSDPDAPDVTLEEFLDESVPARPRDDR